MITIIGRRAWAKKRAARSDSNSSMPLRHIGIIVIWEGNYNPDIFIIAMKLPFLE
ncbi:MAG: hypothetical protein FWC97_01680 [Treponema sp.]|nr:hypothetical protein [Treponema sp.]